MAFLNGPLIDYSTNRKKADGSSTSLLSPHLHFGELSVRKVFHLVRMKQLVWTNEGNKAGEESCSLFLRSIGLREYSRYIVSLCVKISTIVFVYTEFHPTLILLRDLIAKKIYID
jgi:deoxyribodipyrimidine photolyase